jgi:hypothetical protein
MCNSGRRELLRRATWIGSEFMPGSTSLSALHGRTVAIQLSISGRDQILVGRGVYEQDPAQGSVLRIEFAAEVGAAFMICEASWNGVILPGDEVGCDFLIRIT